MKQTSNKDFASLLLTMISVGAVVLVYGYILRYITNGISCDEGYYLMGYLKNQELGAMATDFHRIVRLLTPESMQENVLYFRYLRFVLDFVSAFLFGLASYLWLRKTYSFTINKIVYISFILLSATISYTYTTATISFDHLQHILYLFTFSAFLASQAIKNKIVRIVCLIFAGVLLVFSFMDYPPAGILLFIVFVLFFFVYNPPKIAVTNNVVFLIGVAIGLCLYHFLVNPLDVFFGNLKESLAVASDGQTRHNGGSLIVGMLTAVGLFLLVQLPFIVIGYLGGKIKLSNKLFAAFALFAIVSLIIIRKIYILQANIYYIPVSLVLGYYLALKTNCLKSCKLSEWFLLLVLTFLPFMGIFGTNQDIISKIMIFMPFWMVLFFIIINQIHSVGKGVKMIMLVVVVLYSMGYLYQGNFRRYHSYYTPRSSKYEMNVGERYEGVKVSAYEQKYYRTFADTLQSIGFKPGDTALAFGEQQIGLYLVGGFFHGPIVYSVNQYVDIPKERSRYLFLFKKEEQQMINQLKNTEWNFPEDYNRIEIGKMAENIDDENHNTVIYYIK